MKKCLIFGMSIAGMMMLGSCWGGNGGNKEQNYGASEDSTSVETAIQQDRTIYGFCGDGTAMNTIEMITDSGDTLSLSSTVAQEAGQVFGGLEVKDRLAVLVNEDKTAVTRVINTSTLLGDWVMPDPIDGSAEVGIRIKEGGIAESIEMTNILYRSWRIVNGNLELTSVREGGSQEEEVSLYEIQILGADTLCYKTIGKPREEEETFSYNRWKEKPAVDLHGLQLEEHQDEFMKM